MVSQFRYAKLATKVDKLLAQFGRKPNTTFLERGGTRREVRVLEDSEFSSKGGLAHNVDLRFLISPVDLTIAPDKDLDELILVNDDGSEDRLVISKKPTRISPGGVNVLWQLDCEYP